MLSCVLCSVCFANSPISEVRVPFYFVHEAAASALYADVVASSKGAPSYRS